MGRRTNKFIKAVTQLKSTEIDDKLAVLEAAPTNSTIGYMSYGVHGLPKPDITTTTNAFPDLAVPDFTQDDNANDTTGLFETDGTILTEEPPGDTSYILGPMAAMYYTWSYPWTMIGYIRQSDRKFVNLARISGKLSDWDGVSNFNNSWWGGQITLEQAVWFRDVKKLNNAGNDPDDANYRAFYPGPPSNSPDEHGRYLCTITGAPKNQDKTTVLPDPGRTGPTGKEATADENLAALLDRLRKGAKDIPWEQIGRGLDLAMLAWDVAAVVGLLFPEPTTSAFGAARLARHLRHFGKAKGLARGLKGMSVGATGLKKGGYQAIKGGAKHTGSRGILSGIGKKQVYSAPKVGKVGPSPLNPGSGASKYTKYKSNPLGGGGGDPGGVVGSVVPGGSRRFGVIEPQAAVNPDTFSKGVRLFRKVMGGQYKKSATASKIRKQAKVAGFGGGKANIPFKNLLKQQYNMSGELVVEIMSTTGGVDPISGLNVQQETSVNNNIEKFAAKVPDKDRDKWASLMGQWSLENTTGDQRYAAEIASINMENGGSIGALLGVGYFVWEGGKLIFTGMDDLKNRIFNPNNQEHLDRILQEVSMRTDNPTLMSIGEIDDAMYIIATRDEDWTVNMFDQLIEQDPDANRITKEASDAQDLLWSMRGRDYPGSPYLEPEYIRLRSIADNTWDIMQSNGGLEACYDFYWEGGKEIIETWYNASMAYNDYHNTHTVKIWYKNVKEQEKKVEAIYDSMAPIIERLKVDFVAAWQAENKLEFGDQYVAGIYGDAGMIDIDGSGWFVTPSQLFKMNDSPGNYNLNNREIQLIRSWVQDLQASMPYWHVPNDTDASIASWEREWKNRNKGNVASHDKPFSRYPAAGGDDKWPGLPQDKLDYLHPSNDPLLHIPITPFGMKAHYEPQGDVLSESRRKILKNVKKPVVIPEEQKKFKVKPKIRTSNYMGSIPKISKPVETPKEYKQVGGRDLWGQYEQRQNTRASQERMNQVYELVGDGNMAFDYMLTDSKKMNDEQMEKFWGKNQDLYSYFYGGKKYKLVRKEEMDGDFLVFLIDEHGEKCNILQSELNEKLAEEQEEKELKEFNKLHPTMIKKEPIDYEKDYMFKKVYKRLKPQVDYDDKPAKKGYPNDPPPKMVDNKHPDFAIKPASSLYNRIDPHSAAAMPKQDDSILDDKIKQAENNPKRDSKLFRRNLDDKIKKNRKKYTEEKSDWRKELEGII